MTNDTIGTPVRVIINSGYGYMVQERLEQGWEGYLISFMFNPITGRRSSVIHQMGREVERVYATVLTRIIREPRKLPIAALPLWIVCPDYPVPKHAKQDLRDVVVNDGLHMQGIALIPPWNRMNESLDQHFELHQNVLILPRAHSEMASTGRPGTNQPAVPT